MQKILLRKIWVVLILLISIAPAYGLERNGKIVEIKEDRLAVQVEGGNAFEAGQEVDLSYMAGIMEMLIGRYKIYQVKGDFFAARAVSNSMPPEQGMKVRIVSAESFLKLPSPGAMDLPDRDPRFLEANNPPPRPENPPEATQGPAVKPEVPAGKKACTTGKGLFEGPISGDIPAFDSTLGNGETS